MSIRNLVYAFGEQFGAPANVVMSPDGAYGACVVHERGRWLVVVNACKCRTYDGIGRGGPRFSADSKHLAYAAFAGGRFAVVCDEIEGKYYDGGWDPQFAPNGCRLVYGASRAKRWFPVIDGAEGTECEGMYDLLFSQDGSRVAYCAIDGKRQYVVVDGVENQSYEGIPNDTLTFSPDHARYAYVGKRKGKWYVVVGRDEIGPWKGVARGGVSFSPSGRHIAFCVLLRSGKMSCMLDGKPGREYDKAGFPVFSPSGRRLVHWARRGDKCFVVDNGHEGPAFDALSHAFVFSASGDRLAYMASASGKATLVVDHAPGPAFDGIGSGNVVFSPDENKFAYIGRRGDDRLVVVNHTVIRKHANVTDGCMAFTESGRVGYVGGDRGNLDKLWIGENSFGDMWPVPNWRRRPNYVLVGSNTARYLCLRENAIWIAEVAYE